MDCAGVEVDKRGFAEIEYAGKKYRYQLLRYWRRFPGGNTGGRRRMGSACGMAARRRVSTVNFALMLRKAEIEQMDTVLRGMAWDGELQVVVGEGSELMYKALPNDRVANREYGAIQYLWNTTDMTAYEIALELRRRGYGNIQVSSRTQYMRKVGYVLAKKFSGKRVKAR